MGVIKPHGLLPDVKADARLAVQDTPTDHRSFAHSQFMPRRQHGPSSLACPGAQNSVKAGIIQQEQAYVVVIKAGADEFNRGVEQFAQVKDGRGGP